MAKFTYEDYRKYKHTLFDKVCEEKEEYVYNSIKDTHDKVYRDFLNDKKEFTIFLNQFLNIPIEEKDLIKYNNTFITENYKNRHSDIVYKLKNEEVYIFIEHQSTIDNSINYRILEYYYCILREVIEVKKIKNKNYKFPLIIPILLYTGNKKWDFVPNVREKQLNVVSYDFLNNKMEFEYDFVNINTYKKNELLSKNSMISYIMAIDKCRNNDEVFRILNQIVTKNEDIQRKKYIERLVVYIFKDCLDEKARNEIIERINKGGDDKNMKCSWEYIAEDFMKQKKKMAEQARKEGKVEGKLEGIIESMRKLIKNMLENGENIEKIKLYTGLSVKEIKKIEKELKLGA